MTTLPPFAAVTLAPMGRADLLQVVAIDAEASSRPWSVAAFLTELARDDRCYLVARSAVSGRGDAGSDPVIVGFVGVALFPDEAHVMTIAVALAVQRQGIGAQLVAGMLAEVAQVGLGAVTLEVRAANGPARRLYGRAGFEVAGIRPAYYPDGEDAVILWRRRGVEVS